MLLPLKLSVCGALLCSGESENVKIESPLRNTYFKILVTGLFGNEQRVQSEIFYFDPTHYLLVYYYKII